eukprot:gene5634-37_t
MQQSFRGAERKPSRLEGTRRHSPPRNDLMRKSSCASPR